MSSLQHRERKEKEKEKRCQEASERAVCAGGGTEDVHSNSQPGRQPPKPPNP